MLTSLKINYAWIRRTTTLFKTALNVYIINALPSNVCRWSAYNDPSLILTQSSGFELLTGLKKQNLSTLGCHKRIAVIMTMRNFTITLKYCIKGYILNLEGIKINWSITYNHKWKRISWNKYVWASWKCVSNFIYFSLSIKIKKMKSRRS